MKKRLVIILIAIFAVLVVGIFHRSIIEFIWESKVNFDQEKQNQALNDWRATEDAKNMDESQKLRQMCETALYPEDCNEQPEWRENCLKCEQAGLKKVMEKPIDNSTKIGRQASTEEQKLKSPIIKNLGVNFGDYDSSSKKAGDFSFTLNPAFGKILGEFGQLVGGKTLPHYSYYLPKDTPIMAVADGDVVAVWHQETNDYEIHVKPVYDSYWDINYDHVINPNIKENDTIKAGDIIGYAGNIVEISLEDESSSPGTFYPLPLYFELSLKEEYENKVWKLLSDWETYKGNKNIYDETKMTACPACLSYSLPDVYR